MNKKNKNLLKNPGFQSFLAALVCIIIGIFIGYLVLLAISPKDAFGGITAIMKNFLNYGGKKQAVMKYFGSTLVKTAPLVMCSLSILFAYKVGFFNIGAAGQYVAGAAVSLFFALNFNFHWSVCLVIAILAGAFWGAIPGILKAYRNVNEVISGIMLNWIGLYLANSLITIVKDPKTPFSYKLEEKNPLGKLPSFGLEKLFSNNRYVTIAIPLAVIVAIIIWVILEKTKLGYELKATGANKNAAIYCGMNEKKNTVLTLAISGGLAGLGAAFNYLSGVEQWATTQTSVPGMGFNGIASAFLGGLSPIGAIFSSFFIQHITLGGGYLDKRVYCAQVSDLMSSIIIYLCGFALFFKIILNRALDKKEEKKAMAENEKGGKN
ncbi:MAG: ABC transporter permease [Lachnospiraceae bacterium]|nr:ABC transporter permease [Lachnospiraceae bacterium]MCI6409542.1 ABC transporter permease [Lachnospiraceae bacterium]MDO4508695.1 ABC transporter permease [Lachnospiraceae bacterium]MDY5640061.1 ABC transporter permease [Lachnospiraceae bacterium]